MFGSVGVDLGVKTTHEIVVMEPGEERPKLRFRCGHKLADYEQMLERVQVAFPPGTPLRFVLEPTGTAWVPFALFVQQRGHSAYLVKTQMVRDQRKVLRKHVKTDTVDSVTLSRLPWIAPERLYPLPPLNATLLSLKRCVKQVHRLSMSMARRKQRITAFVHLGLPVGLEQFDLLTVAGRILCTRYLDPHVVKRTGLVRLTRVLQRAAGVVEGVKAVQAWHAACMETLKLYGSAPPVDYAGLQQECAMEMELLEVEQRQCKAAEHHMHELYASTHASRVLESIWGVGPFVAAVCAASLGDGTRFPSARKYRAYTGMIPEVSSSGQHTARGTKMSKSGPNWLKRALYLAAETARQYDPQLAEVYYKQMVNYGHTHTAAICVVATHLADRIWAVYRQNRPYELRAPDGTPMSKDEAQAYIQQHLTVPEAVRERLRHKDKEKHRLMT